MATLVDWTLAEQVGLRFAPRGPASTPSQAHGAVAAGVTSSRAGAEAAQR